MKSSDLGRSVTVLLFTYPIHIVLMVMLFYDRTGRRLQISRRRIALRQEGTKLARRRLKRRLTIEEASVARC